MDAAQLQVRRFCFFCFFVFPIAAIPKLFTTTVWLFGILWTRYQSMAHASSSGKLFSDWRYLLHEPMIDARQAKNAADCTSIVVLSERAIYCLKDSGVLLWTKKADYHPMCFAVQVPRKVISTTPFSSRGSQLKKSSYNLTIIQTKSPKSPKESQIPQQIQEVRKKSKKIRKKSQNPIQKKPK